MMGTTSLPRTRITADQIEADLSKANARLAHVQNQQHGTCDSNSHNENNNSAAVELFRRARELQDQIELLDLNRGVVKLVSDVVAKSRNNRVLESGDEDASLTLLSNATETCTALGFLLLQHNQQSNEEFCGTSVGRHPYYTALAKWYDSLHHSTKAIALNVFRKQLRHHAPEYPSNQRSSALISEALSTSSSSSSSCYYAWNLASRCLVELQVIYDALQIVQQKQGQPSSWRLDILDELCQPLADRVRFHFLEEQSSGIMSCAATTNNNTGQIGGGGCNASKLDRLPEWLFRYLREVVENHGVHSLVMLEGVRPLVNSVIDSIAVRALEELEGVDNEEDVLDFGRGVFEVQGERNTITDSSSGSLRTDKILQHLKCQKYDHAPTYFLREVARMARHAIRAKSFFHHPDVVGSECRDRTIALRGIEQLFLFDSFIYDKAKEGERNEYDQCGEKECREGSVIFSPPRMVKTFLLTDGSLLQWWFEEERDGMSTLLRECASSTMLHSYRSQFEESNVGGEGGARFPNIIEISAAADSADRQQRLYLQISELFVALLHAARCKCYTIAHEQYSQMYIANIVAPLCSEYLDLVHTEASWLRKRLLARPPVLRSANLPSDAFLTWNTSEWASLITGTNLAARAILLHQTKMNHSNHHHGVLDGVGESMKHLCAAMVDEFTSAFVETILMERGKLASYIMRAPFLLSQQSHNLDSPERRRKKDKDMSIRNMNLALSPDLNDSFHVISVVLETCNQLMLKLRAMLPSDQSSSNKPSNALYHGCRSIYGALRFAIGQKLLDIAIDPQGMTPEIYIDGAMQFQHDVMAFDRLFRVGDGSGAEENRIAASKVFEPGPMERAVTASRLMSLESSQIQAIREALRALAVPNSSAVGSIFGRGRGDELSGESSVSHERLDVDDFYSDERLMDEAVSMLEAKNFGALSLDEALSILNRRC
ncbi:hypothetical protein ACHAW5_002741 [Stephanodiscus triporus]|uniref:Uncharacterized protein n=1 Tax=Stephanodiscus triporus TaxID=2934178 RepID=A0ABD3NJM8_9STRA